MPPFVLHLNWEESSSITMHAIDLQILHKTGHLKDTKILYGFKPHRLYGDNQQLELHLDIVVTSAAPTMLMLYINSESYRLSKWVAGLAPFVIRKVCCRFRGLSQSSANFYLNPAGLSLICIDSENLFQRYLE